MYGVMELQLAVWCALLAVVKVSIRYIYSSQSRGPTGQRGLQLAGVWVTRGLKCKLIESVQWHRDELTRCTFLFSLPKTPPPTSRMEQKGFCSDAVSRCMCVIAERGIGHSPYTAL